IDADIVLIYSAGNEYQSQPVASRIPNGSGMLPLITPENTRDGLLYRFLQETDDVDVDPNNPNTWTYFGPGELPDDVVSMDFSDIKGALITVAATDKEGRIASYSNRCGAAAAWC